RSLSPPPAPALARPATPIGIQPGPLKPDLPELRDFIRARRAALAGFMEQGAALALNDDVLTVDARNDIYIRYLSDNRAIIAELASEFSGRAIKVEVSSGGTVVSSAVSKGTTGSLTNGTAKLASSENGAPGPIDPSAEEKEARLALIRDPAIPIAAAPANIETPRLKAGSPEDRQAVLQDPEIRRIFDELEARLVEVRITQDTVDGSDSKKS